MQTFLLGLQAVGYAFLSVAAILFLIFGLMKLVGRLTARKPSVENDNPPADAHDDEEPSEPMS